LVELCEGGLTLRLYSTMGGPMHHAGTQTGSRAGNTAALESTHKLLLEALRSREQEIFHYLAILGPALGGFAWLLVQDNTDYFVFAAGTIGVQLLLLLGAVYSLALGYNYRYIILEVAKLENALGITDAMLVGWPKSAKDFIDRYRFIGMPWCTPPEVIKVFWQAFLAGMAGVTVAAWFHNPQARLLWLVVSTGVACFVVALLMPVRFGLKLHGHAKKDLIHSE
jgi:hypothetical protein